jgi:hypothetical protein
MDILANSLHENFETNFVGECSSRLCVGRLEEVVNPRSRIVDGLIGKPGMHI